MTTKAARAKRFLIKEDVTIKEAMRRLGKVGERILYLVNQKNQLLGSLTDGDIRRWVLAEGALSERVSKVSNRKPVVVNEGYDLEKLKKMMLRRKIVSVPVVKKDSKVVSDVLLWDSVFGKDNGMPRGKLKIPVVIMAGGKGTRLDPFTKILPKPLIPIGDKPIIEIIIDKFREYGVNDFHLSINHKSRMIKAFFEETSRPYCVRYIEETRPLGTVGSLQLLKDKIKDYVLVTNCDIIIEADYLEVLKFHRERKNDLTIVGSFRHFTIPYGICHIRDGGSLIGMQEKPEYDFLVNTGMYLINKDILRMIPANRFFDITDLIRVMQKKDKRIGVFPLDEKSWIDVGQWEEFHRATKLMS